MADLQDILNDVDGDNPPTDNYRLNILLKDLIMIIDNQQDRIVSMEKKIYGIDARTAELTKLEEEYEH